MLQFFILLILVALYFAYQAMQKYCAKQDEVPLKLEQANQRIGVLLKAEDDLHNQLSKIESSHRDLQEQFEKLRFNKISGDVKLGQKFEVILPFLQDFPYPDDEIKAMYQPIDLIVFRENEVVFLEVKTGVSQLSDKQRRIRKNIKEGRVRFEEVRLNEKGVTIK